MSRKKIKEIALTPKEQATTTAYKLQQQIISSLKEQNKSLKKSLEKTQNALEEMKNKKFEAEKKNAVFESKIKTFNFIEVWKTISSLFVWAIIWAIVSWIFKWRYLLWIPFIGLYIICFILQKQK